MKNLISQINIAPEGGFSGLPGSKLNPSGDNAVQIFASFISGIIGLMTIVAIIWAVFTLISGGISIISSGGDKQALESARKRITNGIIGLVVVFVSLFLIELVAYVLGAGDILNLQGLINTISGGATISTGGGAGVLRR